MTPAELKRRAEAARECDIEVGGITFHVRVPLPAQWRAMVRSCTAPGGETDWHAVIERSALASVIGWKGVLQKHLDHDMSLEEGSVGVAFDASLVGPLLEGNVNVLDALASRLLDEYTAREKRRANAEKN